MHVNSFLSLHRTLCGANSSSKKRALEVIASLITEDNPTLDKDDIFLNLTSRERLGSTGLGNGIAIPHCRIKNCATVTGVLVKLDQGIDYEALDEQPVDLIFALVAPEEANDQHLETLATLAEKLSNPTYLSQLRASTTDQELFEAAIGH